MAVVAEELVSELIVRDGKLRAGLNSAKQVYSRSVGDMRTQTRQMEQEFTRSSDAISSSFKNMAAALGGAVTVGAVGKMVDGYTRLQNQLKVAGLEGENLARVQNDLLGISSRYGVGIEGLAGLYGKASEAAGSFGASSEQVLKLTEATSQALMISGTSAAQASGAILGLSQALASGVVRAEEYNQMNEGGLRPLLQAAAAADEYGGDVNKLRAAMLEGEVTSEGFFGALLEGAAVLEGKAQKATLTLAGAITSLQNQLIVYVGEAANSSGATEALSNAISALADNLDEIIPALAAIATIVGVRYAAAFAASTAAMVSNGVASVRAAAYTKAYTAALAENAGMLNAQAIATQRATAATAGFGVVARGAGASLLAMAGGPVVAALTALGAAIAGIAYATRDTAPSLDQLNASLTESTNRLADARTQAKAAGLEVRGVGGAAKGAASEWNGFEDALFAGVRAMDAAASSARNLAIARMGLESAEARQTIAEVSPRVQGLESAAARNRRANAALGQEVSGYQELSSATLAALDVDRQRLKVAEGILAANEESERLIKENPNYKPAASTFTPSGAGGTSDPKKKSRAGGSGTDPVEEAAQRAYRDAQALRALQLEELSAREALATSTTEAADIRRESLDLERQGREAEMAEAVRRKDLSADQAKAQMAVVEKLYGQAAIIGEDGEIIVSAKKSLYGEKIAREQILQELEEQQELRELENNLAQDMLRRAYDLADTQGERRDIALAILDLEQQSRVAKLDEIIAQEGLTDAIRERARKERAAIEGEFNQRREAANRDTESPMERWRRESSRTADQISEDMEKIQVQGFDALTNGITGIITGTQSMGDVFKNVANQIIADLIRIQVQQLIVRSLGNAFGGGSSNSLFGANATPQYQPAGAPFGRAGGGRVSAGQLYRINESGQEYFRPASDGTVISAAQMNAAAMRGGNSGQPVIVQVSVSEGALFQPTVERISGEVSIQAIQTVAPSLVRAAGDDVQRRMSRPRA